MLLYYLAVPLRCKPFDRQVLSAVRALNTLDVLHVPTRVIVLVIEVRATRPLQDS